MKRRHHCLTQREEKIEQGNAILDQGLKQGSANPIQNIRGAFHSLKEQLVVGKVRRPKFLG